jgi:hypothetical protein
MMVFRAHGRPIPDWSAVVVSHVPCILTASNYCVRPWLARLFISTRRACWLAEPRPPAARLPRILRDLWALWYTRGQRQCLDRIA